MVTFWRIIKLSFLQQLTYRTAMLAGLVTNFFWGLFRAAVVMALLSSQGSVNGLDLPGALTFIVVGQAMLAFMNIFGSYELMTSVYTGSIAADLVRPVPLFFLWMGKDLGRSVVNLLGRGVLLVAVYAFFFPIQTPKSGLGWLAALGSLLLGWLLCFAWRFLVNLAAFWTPDARGVGRAAFIASQLLSGFILPLRMYPDWFVQFSQYTPFPGMFNTSMEVYLGLLNGEALLSALAQQAAWLAVLVLACYAVLRLGLRKLVIQGG